VKVIGLQKLYEINFLERYNGFGWICHSEFVDGGGFMKGYSGKS